MTLFMATVIWRQLKNSFVWTLLLQVVVTGGLLFGSAINHAFPEEAVWYAIPHLALAVVFIVLNIVVSVRKT